MRNFDGCHGSPPPLYSKKSRANALALIDQHYGRDVTIADLSDKLMYSPTYINRMLKQQCGSTFNDLLCEKRMQTARELLRSSRMPVGDIAKATGFNSIQSFNRVFKTAASVTPTAYRSGQGQGSQKENI